MTRVLALLVTLFPAVTLTLAQDQSRPNKSEESNSFNTELPILKQKLSDDGSTPEASGAAVARLQTKLEEAKRDAKGVEGLCKHGVLSKLEMEQRLLKVIQCEAELASTRLAEAKQKIADLQPDVASGESAKDQLASVKAALKQLSEAMKAAKAKRERAELEAAEANVRRQQQLLKLGLAAQSDVDGAEEKLAELKAQKN
jgi:multidrug resistance efflux pump